MRCCWMQDSVCGQTNELRRMRLQHGGRRRIREGDAARGVGADNAVGHRGQDEFFLLVELRSVAIANRPVTLESGSRIAERFNMAGKELSSLRRHWISKPRTRLAVKLVTYRRYRFRTFSLLLISMT